MTILSKTLAFSGWGSLVGAAGFVAMTRHCQISPVPPTDYIFNHTLYARFNPNNAPVTQDICTRKVPLDKIKPELLEAERSEKGQGKLVEAFCQGIWGGLGYAYQRRYLEKKYRGPETATDLWERKDLKEAEYPLGTRITDHFEVVSKTPTSIIVRCGDSPRKMDVRDSDGLFEMMAEIKEKEGVAEFGLKSVFYNGLAQPDQVKGWEGAEPPMGPWIQWLHAQYDKLLMETSLRGQVCKMR
ncbi:hypothetical protein KC363_g2944 [Hortaea werneckii]|uniref:Uncharacterized protein n=1 Tax=Hortaea werneckii TaxID=91943 RepID=A0A3M7FBX3_HORWE|nr:hypothetical protein KC361_g7448 [Hortaea werneckii]KAI6887397.1 hypothetical protein KC325_g2136 [Hortaea werneckii]KAI7001434.1 hypothetical protein KC359_g681 [Hortaea werneckii]KAI7085986.1 hypothetical protein KC356_g5438 [Hortaea werneckii]KAI7148977.1 hypothetical protein KC344_g1504 [Hortaea werneckii]